MKYLFLLISLLSIQLLHSQSINILPEKDSVKAVYGGIAELNISFEGTDGFNKQIFVSASSSTISGSYINLTSTSLNFPYTSGLKLKINVNASIPEGIHKITIGAGNGPVSVSKTIVVNVFKDGCSWKNVWKNNFTGLPVPVGFAVDTASNVYLPDFSIHKNGSVTQLNHSNIGCDFYLPLLVDRKNQLWGTCSNQLVMFDGLYWTSYNATSGNFPLLDYGVKVIKEGPSGNLWFLCQKYNDAVSALETAIVYYDGKFSIAADKNTIPLLAASEGASIAADKSGKLWIGFKNSNGVNLIQFNPADKTYTLYTDKNSCLPADNYFLSLAVDHYNAVWIGMGPDNSLVRFDGNNWELWAGSDKSPNHILKDKNCKIISSDEDTGLDVSSPLVREIFVDINNNKWLGLVDRGGAPLGVTMMNDLNRKTYDSQNSSLEYNSNLIIKSDNKGKIYSMGYYGLYSLDCIDNPVISGMTIPEHGSDLSCIAGPNPFSDRIYIKNGESVRISDITGEIIFDGIPVNQEINTVDWKPGIYLIYSSNNKVVKVTKTE